MKPISLLIPIANWALRVLPAVLLYLLFKDFIWSLEFSSIRYLLFFGIAICSVLLVIGGFSVSHTMTILSGLFILIFAILISVLDKFSTTNLAYSLIFAILGFYFFTSGNRKPTSN